LENLKAILLDLQDIKELEGGGVLDPKFLSAPIGNVLTEVRSRVAYLPAMSFRQSLDNV
jgi:hypothetical protein